jgi:hypothetical protein
MPEIGQGGARRDHRSDVGLHLGVQADRVWTMTWTSL